MNILLVESSVIVSERLAAVLSCLDGVVSVKAATTHDEAVSLMQAMSPDVVLIDAHLPDGQAIQVLAWVQEHLPSMRRIVLSRDLSGVFRKRWLIAGAEHVIDMTMQTDELTNVIKMLAERCGSGRLDPDRYLSSVTDAEKGNKP